MWHGAMRRAGMIRRVIRWAVMTERKWLPISFVLAGLVFVAFSPALVGGRTLMLASWDTVSIMNTGAYDPAPKPVGRRFGRTSDPGAPAWTIEPWFSLIGEQYKTEFNPPLWNPYNAYGTPLAASGQPQPFFPLAALVSL